MKTTQIQLRVSPYEKENIQLSAKRAHMDMSQWILSKLFSKPQRIYAQLLTSLEAVQDKQARHYALNELGAFLKHLTSDELREIAGEPPHVKFNDLIDNYVAAMIELACSIKGIEYPKWLNEKSGVAEPFFGSALFSLRLYLLTISPPSFRKRNIFIDSSIGDLI